MINGSEKRNRQLAFELQNSHLCEKRSNIFNLSSNENVHLGALFVILKVRFFALNRIGHHARTTLNWMFCLSLQLARLLQLK